MEKKKGLRKKKGRKFRKVILMIFLIWIAAGVIQNRATMAHSFLESIAAADSHRIPVSEEWNLIVVNRWNRIPAVFQFGILNRTEKRPEGGQQDLSIFAGNV